jgi:uncharacterized protein YdiU (UPF0061 family)
LQPEPDSQVLADAPEELQSDLETLLQFQETDMTIFYRALADVDLGADLDDEARSAPLLDAYYGAPSHDTRERLSAWLRRYVHRARQEAWPERRDVMRAANPKYVLRNYLAQEAIEAAEKGNFSRIFELLELLRKPYDDQPGKEDFAKKRPDWARSKPGCSMLSCSS